MDRQYRTSVFLICGFLGAGKTTLLRKLLLSPKDGEKVAVLVNEFGEISLDGDLVRRDGLEMIELANGCICCSLRIDFRLALQKIVQEIHPHTLYVEATGIAQPHDLLEALSSSEIAGEVRLEALITIVDAHFFRVREVLGPFYNKQLEKADLILINKADLVSQDRLDNIMEEVRSLNPKAVLLPTQFCQFNSDILLSGEIIASAAGGLENLSVLEEPHQHQGHAGEEEQEPLFQSFLFRAKQPLEKELFFEFMNDLPEEIFRCKGYVNFPQETVFINYIAGRFSIEEIRNEQETRLVFIGYRINGEEITKKLWAGSHYSK